MKKSVIEDVFSGVGSTFSAAGYISRHGMMWVYAYIFLLIVLAGIGGWSLSSLLGEIVGDWTESLFNISEEEQGGWLSYVASGVGTFSWLVSKIVGIILMCLVCGYVVLILLSPVFSCLAEKTIKIELGRDTPFAFFTLLWCILRGVAIALRNMVIQLFFTVVLLLIGLIPGVGIFTTIAIFIINAYFLGFAMTDYAMEALKMSIGDSSRYAWGHKGQMTGVGLLYAVVSCLPFVGVYMAIMISPLCVVAGSLQMTETVKSGDLIVSK